MKKSVCAAIIIGMVAVHAHLMAADKVGALGRIIPAGGIVNLTTPSGGIIADIMVHEGDLVTKGSPLAILKSRATCELEVRQAELAVEEAETLGQQSILSQMDNIKAADGEYILSQLAVREADELGFQSILIQKQNAKAAEEEYKLSGSRVDSFEKIGGESLSAQQMSFRRSQVEIAAIKRDLAGKELQRLTLTREINIKRAQENLRIAAVRRDLARKELQRLKSQKDINVKKTKEQLAVARIKLDGTVLNAPINGVIIEILGKVGESSGGGPIITMADLSRMHVIADIFESDLLKLSVGQNVSITSKSLPETLMGKIEAIGRVISQGSKVGSVKILLDHSETAAKLINLEVNVSINL